jgi:hypothetical protein
MKQVLMIGALVAILAIGAGVAAADSIGNDQDAFLNNVAKRLNVTPAALKAALKGANEDRIDAAVAAGKITKEQGDAMKARAAEGGVPFFGGGGHRGGGFGHRGGLGSLDAAATYLGLTEAQLRTQLASGKTLAEIAKAQSKTVDGLEKALTAATKTKLDAAVKDGKLTQAQADDLLKRATEHLDDLVNGTFGPRGDGDGYHHGFGGPPMVVPGSGLQPSIAPVPAGLAA